MMDPILIIVALAGGAFLLLRGRGAATGASSAGASTGGSSLPSSLTAVGVPGNVGSTGASIGNSEISQLPKIASTIGGSLGVGAATGGAAAAAGTGVTLAAGLALAGETAGIAALVALAAVGIGNIARCGTISSIGCVKRDDANLGEELQGHARQIYQAFLDGQINAATALGGMAQLAHEGATYFTRVSDYTTAAPGVNNTCGNFSDYSPAAKQSMGNPSDLSVSSPAYQAMCGMTGLSIQKVLTVYFPSLISSGVDAYESHPELFVGGSLDAAIASNTARNI